MIRHSPEDAARRVQVRIGELKTSSGALLTATLGSCVGVAILSEEPRLAGLAHCLLPNDEPGRPSRSGARFVDSGILNLLREFDTSGIDRRKLRIYIAGGANLIGCSDGRAERQVGFQNLATCRRVLRELGVRYHEIETGGSNGCEIRVDSAAQTVAASQLEAPPYRKVRT